MTLLSQRLLAFAQRFVIGAHNFGLLGAIKVLWFYRARVPAQPASNWSTPLFRVVGIVSDKDVHKVLVIHISDRL